MAMTRIDAVLAATALLAGCASTYDLTLMPRTSGALYKGEAYQTAGSSEAQVSILIDGKGYSGTWLLTAHDYATGHVTAGIGFGGRRGGFGIATAPVIVGTPRVKRKRCCVWPTAAVCVAIAGELAAGTAAAPARMTRDFCPTYRSDSGKTNDA
jgi:hypothetical protein